jgi:hypothetical protein
MRVRLVPYTGSTTVINFTRVGLTSYMYALTQNLNRDLAYGYLEVTDSTRKDPELRKRETEIEGWGGWAIRNFNHQYKREQ